MSRLFTLLPLLLSVADLHAQTTIQAQPIGDTPVQYFGEYHFATQSWTHHGQRAGSRSIYNCSIPGWYYFPIGSSATGGGFVLDEGKLADTNSKSVDQINGFDFSYCSTDFDPTGNSSSIRIAFYDDYAPCTLPSPALCDYAISGLPLSSTGNLQCWAVRIDLEGGFECSANPDNPYFTTDAGGADRTFGWFFSGSTGGNPIPNTGPTLAKPCPTPIAGCTGSNGIPNEGNQNVIFWGSNTNTWNGCYWFGGVPYAAFTMHMLAPPEGSFAFGHVGNTLSLRSTKWDPGGSMDWAVEGHNPANLLFLLASRWRTSRMTSAGEFLLSRPYMVIVPMNSATGTVTRQVPATLRGPIYAQAVETTYFSAGSAVAMSNGLVHL